MAPPGRVTEDVFNQVIDLVAPVRGFVDLTQDDEHDQRDSSDEAPVDLVSSSSDEEGPAQAAIQHPARDLSSLQHSQPGIANTAHVSGCQQPVPRLKEEPRSPTAASRQPPSHRIPSLPPGKAGEAAAFKGAGVAQESAPSRSGVATPAAALAAAGAAGMTEVSKPSLSARAKTDPSSPLYEIMDELGGKPADEGPVAAQRQQQQQQQQGGKGDVGDVSPPPSPSATSLSSPETSSSCQTGDGMQRAASLGGHGAPETSPKQGEQESAGPQPGDGATIAEACSLDPLEGRAPSPASKRQRMALPAAADGNEEAHKAQLKAGQQQKQPGSPGPRHAPGALLAHAAAMLCRAAVTAAASPQGDLVAAAGAAPAAAGDPAVVLVLPQCSAPASAALAASVGGDAGALSGAQPLARPDEAPTASTPHRPPLALLPLVVVNSGGGPPAGTVGVAQPPSGAPPEGGQPCSGGLAATAVDGQAGVAAMEVDAQGAQAAGVACPGRLLHTSSGATRDVQAAASRAAPLPAVAAVLATEQLAAGTPPSPPGFQAGASGSVGAGAHALVAAAADLLAAVNAGASPSPRRSGPASQAPPVCQPPTQASPLPGPSAAAGPGELAMPAPEPPAAAGTGSAAAAAAARPAAELVALPASQPDQQAASGQGDYSNLQFLRSLIPAEVLRQYGPEQQVDPAAKALLDQQVQAFHQEMEGVRQRQEAKNKADMRAIRNLKEHNPDWLVWKPGVGHPPGVEVGRTFVGRCELAAAGVMGDFMRGIDRRGEDPSHAVCVSGGYEDDLDHGDWLIYTGEGGRDSAGNQVADQEWTRGNKALWDAFLQGLPVRVVRGSKENKLQYQYDGLYQIVRAGREANSNKVMVCKFWMVGIPGHYNPAARRVSFMAIRGFKAMQLAGRPGTPDGEPATAAAAATGASKKRAAEAKTAASKAKAVKRGADGKAKAKPKTAVLPAEQRPGFLLADISGGLEQAVKIPVFNEVDQDTAPTHFRYVRSSVTLSPAAQELERQAVALMPGGGRWCGVKQHRGKCFYLPDGRMKETETLGIWECCSGCSSPSCQPNRVVTRGVTLPLEVFKVAHKGWGVRCSADIPVGSVVATYEGEVILNTDAEARGKRHVHADSYFFDLDHVLGMHADRTTKAKDKQRLPPLPPGLDPEEGEHLLVDALTIGNVARFINHSCDPNLVKQIVYTEGSSALKYKMVLVAARDIPAFEELVYDYCYKAGSVPEKEINCRCGARNCRKKLL
ncbi:hypothetical protein N2152v2_009077 [Parachlorella kessleri]